MRDGDLRRDVAVAGRSLERAERTRHAAAGAHDPTATPYFVLEDLLDGLGLNADSHLLDVGCGAGRVLAFFVGAALPVALYFCRGKAQKLMASAVILALMTSMSPSYQWYALFALPLLATYSGKRGSARLKYMFYVFYPAHFAFLGVLYVVAAAIKQAA